MAEKKNGENGVYKRPDRSWSPRTNTIVGIVFILMVMVCFILRAFVGTKNGDATTEVTTAVSSEEAGAETLTDGASTEAVADTESPAASEAATEKVTDAETTEAAAAGTTAETQDEKCYTFRNESTLESHFEKHGSDFTYNNVYEYEAGANAVINNPDSLHKLEAEDGDDVYYLESTNEFVIVSQKGFIRTYFKPSQGKKYYDRQ